jgi:hypothetical protein
MEKHVTITGIRDSRMDIEKLALQIAVAAGSLVPISAGAAGIILGPALLGNNAAGDTDLDSHFRYLSGLLLGIGIFYAGAVPGIERRRGRFLLLGAMVFLGGIGRLLSLFVRGTPSPVMIGALAMELVVTPSLTIWQLRIAR